MNQIVNVIDFGLDLIIFLSTVFIRTATHTLGTENAPKRILARAPQNKRRKRGTSEKEKRKDI